MSLQNGQEPIEVILRTRPAVFFRQHLWCDVFLNLIVVVRSQDGHFGRGGLGQELLGHLPDDFQRRRRVDHVSAIDDDKVLVLDP